MGKIDKKKDIVAFTFFYKIKGRKLFTHIVILTP